jgi:hypothetical protein
MLAKSKVMWRDLLSAPLVFEITTYKLSILDFNQSLRPSAFSATSSVSLWFSNYNLQIQLQILISADQSKQYHRCISCRGKLFPFTYAPENICRVVAGGSPGFCC